MGDGIRLFYRAWKPQQPQEVLACFHGLGAYGGHFRVIGEYLVSLGSQVYVLDLRGHGLSDGPRADLSDMNRIIQDLDEVAAHLLAAHPGLPLYFLGESLAASLVLKYAVQRPQRLRGIILSGIELRPTVRPKAREALRYLPYLIFDTRANVIEMGERERLVSRDPEHFPRAERDPLRNDAFSVRTLVEVHALIQEWPRLARHLTVPTLILQGGGDLLTDPQAAYELLEAIACPDKELAFFPEAYHGLFYDPDTPQVLEALARWLTKRRPPPSRHTSSPSR
jgi:alpha-beta hydrolase superfamily lysophospholipase